jgi:hypothetical protein
VQRFSSGKQRNRRRKPTEKGLDKLMAKRTRRSGKEGGGWLEKWCKRVEN